MDVNELQNFYHGANASNKHCYIVNITAEHGIWQAENPLNQALPILAMQLVGTIFLTRAVYFLLRPLSVPKFFTDILGGVLMGPTALGRIPFFHRLFPLRSIMIVETVAYWALCCHMFLLGLEFDMSVIINLTRTSKKAIHFAIAGVLIPFIMGIGLFLFMSRVAGERYEKTGCLFFGVSLAVTGYPIVARVLNDVKLLHTDIGRLAMSASLVSDLIAWILVVMAIAIRKKETGAIIAVLSTIGFAVFCIFVLRPALAIIIRKTSRENNYSENYLCFVLVAISAFAVITDVLGTNSVVGAFIFGFIMPNRILAAAFLDKFEDFVTGYLLPLFFTVCGIRIDIWKLNSDNRNDWPIALVVIILACSAKVLSTILVSYYGRAPTREGFSLGIILNTKGILAILILHFGAEREFLTQRDYTVMTMAILLMTGVVAPMMSCIYHPEKRLSHYKKRTIQKGRQDGELRILVCFQNFRNVSGMISLIDSSNATKESPLNVFALHLVELIGRASAMLIVHNTGKSSGFRHGSKNSHSQKIVTALETYQTLNDNVNINALTSMSPFASMHEDICSLAEEKYAALLIIPFHKLPSKDGKLEDEENSSFRGVNLNVLANAPCSVGIFVDRGFGVVSENGESRLTMRQILMLFIGGPDDREALAYAWRMGGTEGISLTVVRFLPGDHVEEIEKIELPIGETQKMLTSVSYVDRNRKLDDEYVNEFRLKTAGEQFVSYQERVVNNDEEIVLALQEMHHTYDLYVVGKGEGIVSPLTANLADWCEYPELGPMGDLLITSSFAQGSVLVVKQFAGSGGGSIAEMTLADDSSLESQHFSNWRHLPVEDGGLEMEPFAHQNGKADGRV